MTSTTNEFALESASGDDVMELVIAGLTVAASGHRLYALAITRTNQAGMRAHSAPRWMRHTCQKRLKPSLQIDTPALVHRHRA